MYLFYAAAKLPLIVSPMTNDRFNPMIIVVAAVALVVLVLLVVTRKKK